MKYTITWLPLLFIMEITYANGFSPEDLSQAYSYLNQLRIRAGMTEFSPNVLLETAALNHANYLATNALVGHDEFQGMPGFTGIRPQDRTSFAGYRSLAVSENVSTGSANSIESIDGLMGAIYHRFGFLDLIKNEVGIGIAKLSEPSSRNVYVYNMGNSGLNALCEGSAFSGFGRYYLNVCEPDIHLDANDFENVEMLAQGNNPNIVLWPTDGDNNVPPAFFEEMPDPLPDYSVSGYPISIQFNPLTFSNVNVTEFRLYRESDNYEIQPTRLLNQSTDPNGKLSALEYVLFPLQRLDWNTAYRVEAKYTTHVGSDMLVWRFQTKDVGMPLYTIQGQGEVLSITQDSSTFAVYVPPTFDFPNIAEINSRYFSGMTLNFGFIDGNTLWINVSGNAGQEATFNFSGGRHFVVKMTEACEPATLSSELRLYIPTLHYTSSPNETPIVLWMDLGFLENTESPEALQFQIFNYDLVKQTSRACQTATLSPELQMHIANLHYTPPNEAPVQMWGDLELVEGLLFEALDFGPAE